ncbi:unnamed protein product [Amoebophrya sp. A25]|nr:unnamed protein product [Amoebophrya sp. A25]|eukprot:GSA25T00000607001.1
MSRRSTSLRRIEFVYGDLDWMDRESTLRLLDQYPDILRYHLCPCAGHQIPIDNPVEFARIVKENTYPYSSTSST